MRFRQYRAAMADPQIHRRGQCEFVKHIIKRSTAGYKTAGAVAIKRRVPCVCKQKAVCACINSCIRIVSYRARQHSIYKQIYFSICRTIHDNVVRARRKIRNLKVSMFSVVTCSTAPGNIIDIQQFLIQRVHHQVGVVHLRITVTDIQTYRLRKSNTIINFASRFERHFAAYKDRSIKRMVVVKSCAIIFTYNINRRRKTAPRRNRSTREGNGLPSISPAKCPDMNIINARFQIIIHQIFRGSVYRFHHVVLPTFQQGMTVLRAVLQLQTNRRL